MHASRRTLRSPIRWCLTLLMAAAPITPALAQLRADRAEVVLRAGDPAARRALVRIANPAPEAVVATLAIEDWERDSTGAWRGLPAGTSAGSCGARLLLSTRSVSIAPGGQATVEVRLADSVRALPRECWNALLVEPHPAARRRTRPADRVRTAVLLYAQPAEEDIAGELTDLHLLTRGGGADSVEVWVRNTGTVHAVARGVVEFRHLDRTLAGRVVLPPLPLLPGAHQRVRAALPAMAGGSYEVVGSVDFGAALASVWRSQPAAGAR